MKVGFFPNLTKESVYDVLKTMAQICEKYNMELFMPKDLPQQVRLLKILPVPVENYLPRDEIFQTIDLAFSFGGDGTLIQLAKEIVDYEKPICGINMGELGFLNQIELETLEEGIEKIANGEYDIEERLVLSSYIEGDNGHLDLPPAINDVVVTRSGPGKMARMILHLDGVKAQQYPADGLIFSTATGSTSYNLSSGGPILSPENHSIIVTPVCPHLVQNASLVFKEDSTFAISLPKREKDVYVSVDGTYDYTLHNDEMLYVKPHHKYSHFVRLSNQNFFVSLYKKLNARREAIL